MEDILEKDFDNPYCTVCNSCGEDGCCPASSCTFEEGCKYGKGYLDDLKFGYWMYKDLSRMIHNRFKDVVNIMEEYDKIFDENYKIFYKEMIEQQKLAKLK